MHSLTSADHLLEELMADPEYLVLRLFKPGTLYREYDKSKKYKKIIVLDTESTGIDKTVDAIVELGMVSVLIGENNEFVTVEKTFSKLEDPGIPISKEASRVNKITDEMVKNKFILDAEVEEFIEGASLIIAHNSGHDRAFAEKRFSCFKHYPWACSLREIPWDVAGISSGKLEFIAYKQGFFYSAHRAEGDCLALINTLLQPLTNEDTGEAMGSGLSLILNNYVLDTFKLWAVAAPFDAKDKLKKRGYRWHDGSEMGSEKAWAIEVLEENLDEELSWLRSEIYKKNASIMVDTVSALDRYTPRRGSSRIKQL